MLTADYFVAEGFKVTPVKDLGGWKHGKTVVATACRWCGMGLVFFEIKGVERGEVELPVHDFCYESAKAAWAKTPA